MDRKLADWDDDEPKAISKRWEKVIVLKNAFTLDELQDASTAFDIKQDIMEGCEDIGPVTSVTLYDLEPEGIATVKFQEKDDAVTCIEVMNGRYFGGKQLEAFPYDGKIKYRKSKKDGEDDKEQERLDKFGSWLNKGE
ncbi:Cus2p [Sugiyamaella lignohabitans]|uniref:Cus2p n=1 Tax=Sugiyamaella lignohabitans TaxID=796027 RepID=A0A167EER8_9ASCO|nr:Cus2p [Sugiyamaella lignohabitans]ANB13985.1 Cus2p [Sugiyamaella lignohabitans]